MWQGCICKPAVNLFAMPAVFDILHQHEQPTTTVIVVSPLRALMKDQVDTFTKKGIKAVRISSVEEEVKHAIMDDMSPKTLLTDTVLYFNQCPPQKNSG